MSSSDKFDMYFINSSFAPIFGVLPLIKTFV
nr:MAG TPA: hypothetical protein [Caudoviricetes sp.]